MTFIKLFASSALLLFAMATSQETTISVPLSTEEIDEVTFDASRVSEAEVRSWLKLSRYGFYPTVIGIEFCFDEPQYAGCKGSYENINTRTAGLNLDKMRAVIRELDSRHDPPGLLPVVAFLKRTQTFWLWIESQKLAFFETGDVAVLESEFDRVDPKLSCGTVLNKIRNAKNKPEAWRLTQYGWHTCVLKVGTEEIGPYPDEAWRSFLDSQGIRERIGSTIEE